MAKEKSKVYEYVIILHRETTTKDGEVSYKSEKIAQDSVLATGEQQALIHASRKIPDSLMEQLDNMEIIVRPF